MNLLRKFVSLFRSRPEAQEDVNVVVFYVQCDKCGEIVRVRIDTRWDLAQEFDNDVSGYALRKEVVGGKCNHVMIVDMAFDRNYTITAKNVEGGRFATPKEYKA